MLPYKYLAKILSLILGYNNEFISGAMEWWEISNLEPIPVNGNIQNGELNEEIKIKKGKWGLRQW